MESVDGAVELFKSGLLRTLHKRLIIYPEITKARKILGKKNFSMLDIGCGTGLISQIWADSGAIVTGLEPSPKRAEIARQRGINVLTCYAPQSFTRRFPRIGRALSTTPLSMLFFAPLIGLGYVTGRSDNITVFAKPQKKA